MPNQDSSRPSLLLLRDQVRSLDPLGGWAPFGEWSRLLELVAARRSMPPGAPILTILLGPTGVGKSTLFNQIAGRSISAPGAVRPSTTHPIAVAAPEPASAFQLDPTLREATANLELVIGREMEPILGRQVLVDTPDFDSVAEKNRRSADALIHRADRVILVLSPEKYADSAVWAILASLHRLGSATGCVFNKVESRVAFEDCSRLLADAGLPAPLPIPRVPNPDFPLEPGLRRKLLALVSPPPDPVALLRARRESLERWEVEARHPVLEWIDALHRTVAEIEGTLRLRSDELPDRIREQLPLQLDEALSRELEERFLEKIQKYDFLKEPRRWLSAPFRLLARALPFGSGGSTGGRETPSPAQWLTEAYRDRYLSFLADLLEDLRALALRAEAGTDPRLSWPDAPDLEPQEALRGLEETFRGVQSEAERESERISGSLSLTGRIGFYGSQAVFNLLVFGVLVKTGGGLNIGDLAAQGLLSPYLAKLAAHLVSSGEVEAVRKRLEESLCRRLEAELRPRFQPMSERAEALRAAAGTPAQWRRAALAWDARSN